MGFTPMFAEAATVLPRGPEWRYEPKYDGMRALGIASAHAAQLLSREGHDYTGQFPEVVEALAELRAAVGADLILDGELVASLSDGYAGYHALSHRLGVQDRFRIRILLDFGSGRDVLAPPFLPGRIECGGDLRLACRRIVQHASDPARVVHGGASACGNVDRHRPPFPGEAERGLRMPAVGGGIRLRQRTGAEPAARTKPDFLARHPPRFVRPV